MNIEEFIKYCKEGNPVSSIDKELSPFLHECAQNAIKICMEINNGYHTPEEVRKLFEKLTGENIDESFTCFPPFYSDFGRNTKMGRMYFLTADAHFKTEAE